MSSQSVESSQEPIEAEVMDDGNDMSTVGRIRSIFGMLTRFIGVKDMSSLRISLPSGMLMPMSNLEFWNYVDRPDFFLEIPDPDDPLDRMLKVVRWWYSKDTKWMVTKLAKPYNSVLGEQFLCHWDVNQRTIQAATNYTPASSNSLLQAWPPPSPLESEQITPTLASVEAELKLEKQDPTRRVYSITEQISHHPPISAYLYYSPDKKVMARGVDHISGKFTGTSLKVFPGSFNKGIYVTLESRDNEEYNLTHPCASIAGFMRASLYITVGEQTVITCPKTRLMAVLEYKDEPFFGSPRFAVQGTIFSYDPATYNRAQPPPKPKDRDILCTLHGSWKGKIYYRKVPHQASSQSSSSIATPSKMTSTNSLRSEDVLLLDMETLHPFRKLVDPQHELHPKASRTIWKQVSENIVAQNFAEATRHKRLVEDAQRQERQERAQRGESFQSEWFHFLDGSKLGGVDAGRDAMPEEVGAGLEGKPFLRTERLQELPWNNSRPLLAATVSSVHKS